MIIQSPKISRKSVKFINRNGLKLPGTFIRGAFIGNQALWLKNIYEMFVILQLRNGNQG